MISLSRFFALGAVAIAGAAVSAVPTFAQTPTFTFAQYLQQSSAQSFVLTNNGPTSTITATDQVRFFYLPNAAYPQTAGLPTNQFNGTLTFTASNPTGPATGSNTPNTFITETFSTYSFSIISDVASGSKNLLTGVGNNLLLSGKYNEGSSTLQVSTPPGSDVVFTSDYVNFATSTDRNFSFSMSSVVPVLVIDTTNPIPTDNGYVRSFTAAGTGTFASNFNNPAPVPEPGMVTFALTGGAGLMGMVIRGRRRFSKKSA